MVDAGIFVLGAAVAWGLVRGIRQWAPQLGLMDAPNQRSLHRQPTPRGGGAAIAMVSLLGIALAAAVGLRPTWPVLAGYVAGALLIAVVSWVDDVRSVPSAVRLAVQALAATLMLAGLGVQSESQVIFGRADLGWLLVAAGLLWTIGITNAYNFMDGIDGLAGLQGIVAGLGWVLLASLSGQPWIALLALLIGAGSAGFLVHNWPPASVFMGDVGGAFLGFTFAFITLAASKQSPNLAIVGGLLLWPFVFDTALTLLRRLTRGENVFVAHRSHLYQRLVLAGWQQVSVTSLYGVMAAIGVALAAVWWLSGWVGFVYVAVAVMGLLSLLMWAVVTRAERLTIRTGDVRPLRGR